MKHVVITGASRGLGRAMALGFAADSWTVSGCGTDPVALQSLQDLLGSEHHLQSCDVTDPAAVEEFAATVTKRFGPPDLLLNNAAIINPNQQLWRVSPEAFARVVDVNLKGVHLVLRALLPGMIRRGSGVLVKKSEDGVSSADMIQVEKLRICSRWFMAVVRASTPAVCGISASSKTFPSILFWTDVGDLAGGGGHASFD